MTDTVSPKVVLIAKTEFFPPVDVPWSTDVDGGEALAEFAGRACYQSWKKSNPVTATNAGYLRHILEVGRLSARTWHGEHHVDIYQVPDGHGVEDYAVLRVGGGDVSALHGQLLRFDICVVPEPLPSRHAVVVPSPGFG